MLEILSMIGEYLLGGQFWFANFLALASTLYWGFTSTGPDEGNLRWSMMMTNTKNQVLFIVVFILCAVLFNAAIGGMIAGLSVAGVL